MRFVGKQFLDLVQPFQLKGFYCLPMMFCCLVYAKKKDHAREYYPSGNLVAVLDTRALTVLPCFDI